MKKAAAAEDLSAKKELALQVIDRLKTEYPDAACTLDYDHAWQLLVSVRLAAQCTDARVNIVVQDLFAKYPNVAALAAAEPEEIEAIVKPCGLGRSKARDISACMRVLRDKYNCKVPTTFEELLALPGVGRKSANLIMGDVFCKPAIVTDTHCIRLCNKIGLVDGIKEPQKLAFMVAFGYPTHKAGIVPMTEQTGVKYYLDENRDYCVPKRSAKEIARSL